MNMIFQNEIDKLRMSSKQFYDRVSGIKEEDNTAKFYLNNIKRLSLQSLDLFTAMQKQAMFLNNQKRFLATKNNLAQRRIKHEKHDISLD
jgi:hypothetical protein